VGTWSLLLAGLVLGAAATARADLLSPSSSRELPPGFIALDERDQPRDLLQASSGAPWILLPIFTRCGGTCPLTALSLKDALGRAEAPFRVVALSFDSDDAANDLREFRERFGIPPEWLLLRSADGAATRALLDPFDFHFMKSGGGFEHPNEAFVFSPRGRWAATFAGTTFSKDQLESAWRRAWAADAASPVQRLRWWLSRPEAWILVACGGLLLSFAAILLFARKARTAVNPPGSSRDASAGSRAH